MGSEPPQKVKGSAVTIAASGPRERITRVEGDAQLPLYPELARARADVTAALKARDDFLAAVVHDLRQPLVAAGWHVQILRTALSQAEAANRDEVMGLLGAVDDSIASLSARLDELRDACRLQDGRPLELRLRPVDLVQLVHNVVARFATRAGEPPIWFVSRVGRLVGHWEPERLDRVLVNLLSNAVLYSPAGGDILVSVERRGQAAVVIVQDHGLGIPAADLPHIFERYWRGSNVSRRIAGSGIGLADAWAILAQHRGTLAVTSHAGQGSTFTVCLPLTPSGRA